MAITNMIAEGGLQILPLDIVQHVLCLLILIFFMTTLVYNPVLNFINNRKASVEATVKENERLSAEVKEIKENADKIVEEARKKAELENMIREKQEKELRIQKEFEENLKKEELQRRRLRESL